MIYVFFSSLVLLGSSLFTKLFCFGAIDWSFGFGFFHDRTVSLFFSSSDYHLDSSNHLSLLEISTEIIKIFAMFKTTLEHLRLDLLASLFLLRWTQVLHTFTKVTLKSRSERGKNTSILASNDHQPSRDFNHLNQEETRWVAVGGCEVCRLRPFKSPVGIPVKSRVSSTSA